MMPAADFRRRFVHVMGRAPREPRVDGGVNPEYAASVGDWVSAELLCRGARRAGRRGCSRAILPIEQPEKSDRCWRKSARILADGRARPCSTNVRVVHDRAFSGSSRKRSRNEQDRVDARRPFRERHSRLEEVAQHFACGVTPIQNETSGPNVSRNAAGRRRSRARPLSAG